MKHSDEIFLAECSNAISTASGNLLNTAVGNYSRFIFDGDNSKEFVPDNVFRFIVKQFNNPVFWGMSESHYLVNLILYDWNRFTTIQQPYIVQLLIDNFPHFRDSMTQFVIVEILCKYVKTDESVGFVSQQLINDSPILLDIVKSLSIAYATFSDISQCRVQAALEGLSRRTDSGVSEDAAVILKDLRESTQLHIHR